MSSTTTAPAGWYPDTQNPGFERWWDGENWTGTSRPRPITAALAQPIPASSHRGPMTARALNVERRVSYVRQQKGHSLTLHLIFGVFLLFIPTIYYTVSPNHYWHA
jgi:hypothetical protein